MPRRPLLLVMLLAGCSPEGRQGQPGAPDLAAVPPDMAASSGATRCAAGPAHRLSSLPGAHRSAKVAFTGAGFVVAWNTEAPGGAHRIDVAVTDGNGHALGPNIPLSAPPVATADPPSLAPLVGGTAVAWSRAAAAGSDIVLSTLDGSGQRLDVNGVACDPADAACGIFAVTSSHAASAPALGRPQADARSAAPTNSQVALAFVDARNHPCSGAGCSGFNDVYWKKLQTNGTVLTPERALTPAGANLRSAAPRMAFDGAHDGVVWRDDTLADLSRFAFVTVDQDGALTSGPTRVAVASGIATVTGTPGLVWSRDSYALATGDGDASGASVVFQRFASNGNGALAGVPVTFGRSSCAPTLAYDGLRYANAWQTPCSDPRSAVAFELIDEDGVRVQSNGQSCGTSTAPNCGVIAVADDASFWAGAPDVAWAGGSSFGVAWQQHPLFDGGDGEDDVWFARVDCVNP